jgi:hypothetical protein
MIPVLRKGGPLVRGGCGCLHSGFLPESSCSHCEQINASSIRYIYILRDRLAASTRIHFDNRSIVGRWIWIGARDVIVNADGTAKQPGEATAEWKLLHTNNTVERKYEFIWSRRGGKTYIHTVVLSNDGQRLDGKNQVNQRIWAKRVN